MRDWSRCWIRFYLYWFQIFICNKCNLWKLLNNSCVCFAEIGCVFLRCSRSAILVLAKESVFLEVFKVISLGCCVDILRVSEKTGCSSSLEWTSINNCVQSLYPYLFKFSLFVVCWYKQSIVSKKQPIVFF